MKTTFQRFSRTLACVGFISFLSAITARSGTVAFYYDQAGRLTTATFAAAKSIAYIYDPAGNLLQRAINIGGGNPDSDGDRMADAWEIFYFETITAQDGTGDFDHDGFSDLSEFLAGTLPKDSTSALKMLPTPEINGSSVTVQWSAVSGKTYRLQFKNSLNDLNWSSVSGDVTSTGTTASKLDPTGANLTGRFYRVLLVE